MEGTIQGVVSGQQGAASIIPSNPDPAFVSLLSTPPSPYLFGRGANDTLPFVTTVGIDPATGVLSGTLHINEYQDGRYASGVYTLTQTPQTTPVAPITGGTSFVAPGVFVQNNTPYPIHVGSYSSQNILTTALTQLPLYGSSETYNGFRISAGSTPFALASVEGYGWGTMTGTGATPLPTSYTGGATTGYFVSQDLPSVGQLPGTLPGIPLLFQDQSNVGQVKYPLSDSPLSGSSGGVRLC